MNVPVFLRTKILSLCASIVLNADSRARWLPLSHHQIRPDPPLWKHSSTSPLETLKVAVLIATVCYDKCRACRFLPPPPPLRATDETGGASFLPTPWAEKHACSCGVCVDGGITLEETFISSPHQETIDDPSRHNRSPKRSVTLNGILLSDTLTGTFGTLEAVSVPLFRIQLAIV